MTKKVKVFEVWDAEESKAYSIFPLAGAWSIVRETDIENRSKILNIVVRGASFKVDFSAIGIIVPIPLTKVFEFDEKLMDQGIYIIAHPIGSHRPKIIKVDQLMVTELVPHKKAEYRFV